MRKILLILAAAIGLTAAPATAFATDCHQLPGDACKGAKGDKGDKGDPGAPGATGATGAQGEQGIQGEQGVAGIQGETGATGAQGEQGEKGEKGDAGKDFNPDDLNAGLATNAALHIPHVEKAFAASVIGGFHEDKSAVGVGVGIRFDETWQFGGSIAVGTDGDHVGGKAALTGQW